MILRSKRSLLVIAGIAGLGMASLAAADNPERNADSDLYYGEMSNTPPAPVQRGDRLQSRTAESTRQKQPDTAQPGSERRHNYSWEYKQDLDPRIGGLQRESAPN